MEIFRVGNFVLETVSNPSDTLSSANKADIVSQSIPIARAAFRNEGVTESDAILHAINVSTGVYLRDSSGKLIGFSGCIPESILGRTVIHLKGTALMPNIQGEGLYSLITVLRILFEVEKHNSENILIGTRTQNPIVFYTMSDKLGLYPRISSDIPADLKPIARAYVDVLFEKHSDFHPQTIDFDPNTFIIRRSYGGVGSDGKEYGFSMYGNNIPWLKNNERINHFIKDNLDLNNGDAFLLLGPNNHEKDMALLKYSLHRANSTDVSLIERFEK